MMERLLKDYLVECTEENENIFLLICMICGKIWESTPQKNESDNGREEAAREAAVSNHVCNFCGRPVCRDCFMEAEGIELCVECGAKLYKRLEI